MLLHVLHKNDLIKHMLLWRRRIFIPLPASGDLLIILAKVLDTQIRTDKTTVVPVRTF